MKSMHDACNEYIRLLKQNEEMTNSEIALARESFQEGWMQHEQNFKQENV